VTKDSDHAQNGPVIGGRERRRSPLAWVAIALLALAGFSVMHVGAVTDVSSAGHVIPAPGDAGWAGLMPAVHGHPDQGQGGAGGTDGHGSHEHEALLGCLIALTGLGLVAVVRRSPSWVSVRAEVGRLGAGAVAVVAAIASPELTRLRLQVLRI